MWYHIPHLVNAKRNISMSSNLTQQDVKLQRQSSVHALDVFVSFTLHFTLCPAPEYLSTFQCVSK